MIATENRLVTLSHFTAQANEKSLLRVATAGSVDDGKSTLLGRMLVDSNGAFDDQIEAVRASKINRAGGSFDFSLLTDGLRAEREQGITIDVAYRYFSTPRRKFILADTPGHVQYTRNMVTGASTADAAILLIDARYGILDQTRLHASISARLGIRELVVAVNKMDLVGWSGEVYERIRAEFATLARSLGVRIQPIPVSALLGDNVVTRSESTPYYDGPTLLHYLENVDVERRDLPFRMPVQYVLRPDLDFRGFAGQIVAGSVRAGDEVVILPAGRRSRIDRIHTFDGDLEEAIAPMSVTLVLADEIDISRGDVIAAVDRPPRITRRLGATLIWLDGEVADSERAYTLRQGPASAQARLTERRDLHANDIAEVTLETSRALAWDAYGDIRAMGAFVLIDPISNRTVAGGLFHEDRTERQTKKAASFRLGEVTASERVQVYGHTAGVITHHGLVDLADQMERALFEHGARVARLDVYVPGLVSAGLIQIVPDAPAEAVSLELIPGLTAEQAMDRLGERGILLNRDQVSEGEGI
jgi:sulfate adenylyltransferase large subunit